MNYLGSAVLLGWLPLVVMVFSSMPPKKAVTGLFVTAWLALPPSGFGLPGLPDYTKVTATVLAVLLCTFIFDAGRLFALRPRWVDLPILVWCLGTFVTALTNDLGVYEAASSLLETTMIWGFPYLIGRMYLDDVDALSDLAQAIVVGGLIYIPLCLFEIRFSPILQSMIYGTWRVDFNFRYGGYRPQVFLATGLELGMWMANATLLCSCLRSFGTIKEIRGFAIGKLFVALLLTSIVCKSTGAILLMLAGMGALRLAKAKRKTWAIWLIIAIPPGYCLTRTFDLWSGREVVDIASSTVGEDRAQSFGYRLDMERVLADHALQRPLMGWGRFNRSQVTNAEGKVTTVPDGYWIIALGLQGLVGVAGLVAMFILPMIVALRRYPTATWSDPRIGPVVGLSMVLVLTMIDFLSNAMLNPIYPLAIGGLLGHARYYPKAGLDEAEAAMANASGLVEEGRMSEAGEEFLQAIELSSGSVDVAARTIQAEALDGLGHSLQAAGRLEEAVETFREALVIRDDLAAEVPDDDRFRDLAIARDSLSRALAESGRTPEAVEERRIALQLWEALASHHPKDTTYRDHHANTLNDLAWLLATDPDPAHRDPSVALALAEEAVQIAPDHDALWNTLGVARYRAGDWTGAIEALERSALSGLDGLGTAFDHYFLAMAWTQLHREDQGLEWLERGTAWSARFQPDHPTLERFRQEAESLLAETDEGGDAPRFPQLPSIS